MARKVSDELQRQAADEEIRAACVLDSSLIVLRRPSKLKSGLVLYKHDVTSYGSAAGIRKGREIGRLKLSAKTAGDLSISALSIRDQEVYVVAASNGSIDVVRLGGQRLLYNA